MLQSQLTKGNNGLVKKKYISFGIEADSLRTAKPKLERIETDILNNFKTLGVRTEPLSGYERLKVLHDVFNMDTNEPFRFSFDMVARTGLSTKDFIAPTSFDFREGKCCKMGRTIGAVSFLPVSYTHLMAKSKNESNNKNSGTLLTEKDGTQYRCV